jgi:hypothetical protein
MNYAKEMNDLSKSKEQIRYTLKYIKLYFPKRQIAVRSFDVCIQVSKQRCILEKGYLLGANT